MAAPQAPQSAVPVRRVLQLLTNGSLPADCRLPWLTVKEGADGGLSLHAEPQDCIQPLRKRAEELRAQGDTDRAQDCLELALDMTTAGEHDEGQRIPSVAEQVVSAMHAVHRLAEEAERNAATAITTSASAELMAAALNKRCVAAEQRAAAAEERAAAAEQRAAGAERRAASAEGEVAAVRASSTAAEKSAAAAEQRAASAEDEVAAVRASSTAAEKSAAAAEKLAASADRRAASVEGEVAAARAIPAAAARSAAAACAGAAAAEKRAASAKDEVAAARAASTAAAKSAAAAEKQAASAERRATSAEGEVAAVRAAFAAATRNDAAAFIAAEQRATSAGAAAKKKAAAAARRAASAQGTLAGVRAASTAAERRAAAAEQRGCELAKELQSTRSAMELLLQQHLQLQLRIGGGAAIPVLLPKSATAAVLKAVVRELNGPPSCCQQLTVGGEQLDVSGATPLSDSQLLTKDAVVDVSWAVNSIAVICGDSHAIVQLPGREHVEWGYKTGFNRADASAVCAGSSFTVGIVAGKLVVWGASRTAGNVRESAQQMEGKEVVSCSAWGHCAAAATRDGFLYVLGYLKDLIQIPSDLQGSVSSVAIGAAHVVVQTHEDTVIRLGFGKPSDVDLSGEEARSVHAGRKHFAVVLDDGSVCCGGDNGAGQCDVPDGLSDVVACACGDTFTVALDDSGTLTWWGKVPEAECIDDAGPIAGIAVMRDCVVAVATNGRLLEVGSNRKQRTARVPPLADGLRGLFVDAPTEATEPHN